jgi:hypothetical protein
MIKNQSKCPYCGQCVVAYDWDANKIVFNPDQAKPNPCEHLAYVGVYCITLGQLLAHRHKIWPDSIADSQLAEYLRHIGLGTESPDADFEVTVADYQHRHASGTDSVTLCGIYSLNPSEFLAICGGSMRKDWDQ